MSRLPELLSRAIRAIDRPSPAQRALLDRLEALRARLDQGLLRVAALGQFKRGKSTLLNALLGSALLPTGVTPVTAIPTFIRAGETTRGVIRFDGGRAPLVVETDALPAALERHVSEDMNPNNRLGVASVSIETPSSFLGRGVVLIDTPGIGSTHLHNTQAAEAALAECDAALFVLSADPPITEAEARYLDKIYPLVSTILFVLNKIDLLDGDERSKAETFLARTLDDHHPSTPRPVVFSLSARRALAAKRAGDSVALEGSGLPRLERALVDDLMRRKHDIIEQTGRLRLLALVDQLRFQTELEHAALRTPLEELRRKAETFETAAAEFSAQRDVVADLLSIDRKRLLGELEVETDRLWADARQEIGGIVAAMDLCDEGQVKARNAIAAALAARFDHAFATVSERFRDRVNAVAAAHDRRMRDLLDSVRRTAADLMNLAPATSEAPENYLAQRDPYWVAADPSMSLVDLTTKAATLLLPRALRRRRERDRLLADAEKAALRNVANLDWALRRNIEESLRRLQSTLSADLDSAIEATRQAMQIALRRRDDRSEAIANDMDAGRRAIGELAEILRELGNGTPREKGAESREDGA
ncbi:MAG TPA: dynamin family protein [Rhodoblastus sp.]|nr:dynamin family protein [Rhodoblastus sp.]